MPRRSTLTQLWRSSSALAHATLTVPGRRWILVALLVSLPLAALARLAFEIADRGQEARATADLAAVGILAIVGPILLAFATWIGSTVGLDRRAPATAAFVVAQPRRILVSMSAFATASVITGSIALMALVATFAAAWPVLDAWSVDRWMPSPELLGVVIATAVASAAMGMAAAGLAAALGRAWALVVTLGSILAGAALIVVGAPHDGVLVDPVRAWWLVADPLYPGSRTDRFAGWASLAAWALVSATLGAWRFHASDIGVPPSTAPARVTSARAHAERAPRSVAARMLASAWMQLRTVRSTWWFLAAIPVALFTIGIASALTVPVGADATGTTFANVDLTGVTGGVGAATLISGALGAVFGGQSQSTGIMRALAAAWPRRALLVLANTAVVVAASTIIALIALFALAAVVPTILDARGMLPDQRADELISHAVRGAIAIGASGALGYGLGVALRSVVTSLLVLAALMTFIPSATRVMSVAAGQRSGLPGDPILDTIAGAYPGPLLGAAVERPLDTASVLALLGACAWVVACVVIAAITVERRDVR